MKEIYNAQIILMLALIARQDNRIKLINYLSFRNKFLFLNVIFFSAWLMQRA